MPLETYLAHLEALPFVLKARVESVEAGAGGSDGQVACTTPTGTVTYPLEVARSHLGTAEASRLIQLATQTQDLIVFAPLIGATLGEQLAEAGVQFMDLAGNCFVRWDGRYVARVQGRKAPTRRVTERALRAPSYRIMLVWLVRPDLVGAPLRETADAADVSPQTVSNLRKRWLESGALIRAGREIAWARGGKEKAMKAWLRGFESTLLPSLVIGHYRARERAPAALEARIEPVLDRVGPWAYSGGAAAMRLTGYYRGDTTDIYLANTPVDLASQLQLVPDAAGPVRLAQLPSMLALDSPAERCVHPLLVYTDLLAEDHDRARDAAAEVRAQYLSELGAP